MVYSNNNRQIGGSHIFAKDNFKLNWGYGGKDTGNYYWFSWDLEISKVKDAILWVDRIDILCFYNYFRKRFHINL